MDVGSWKNRSCNDGSGVGKVITMKLIIVFVVVSVILMVIMVVVQVMVMMVVI